MVFQQTQLFFSMACYIDYFSPFLLCQNSLIWYRLSFTKEAGMPSTMNLLEEDLDDDEEPLNPMAEVCIRISPTLAFTLLHTNRYSGYLPTNLTSEQNYRL